MAYIVLKTEEGQVTLTPANIKIFEKQITDQFKNMTLTEMLTTGQALKSLILNPTLSALSKLV